MIKLQIPPDFQMMNNNNGHGINDDDDDEKIQYNQFNDSCGKP